MATKTHLAISATFLAIFISSTLFVTVCSSNTGRTEYEFFDSYINNEFVTHTLHQNYPLDFIVENRNNTRSYSYTLKFKQTHDNQYYLFSLVVAKAAVLLNPDEYRADYKEFIEHHSASEVETKFPKIGKRAEKETGFFGPGGSSYSIVFTTSDGQFDVKLVVSMLLPENVDSPNIDIRRVAQLVSAEYDKYKRPN